MLAPSPRTTNLAAAAATASQHQHQHQPQHTPTRMTSSSMAVAVAASSPGAGPSTPRQHSIAACPDDSDFLESDADHDDMEHRASSSSFAMDSEDRLGSPGSQDGDYDSTPTPLIPLIYISNRLYFTFFDDPPPPSHLLNHGNGAAAALFEAPKQQRPGQPMTAADVPEQFHWFNIDDDLVYLSFFEDWGPLNVALFYRFCMHIHQLLNDSALSSRALVFYTSDHPHKKANASLLAAMYSMIIDHIEPADAFHPFSQIEFKPFRDAGYGRPDYCLTMQDVLYGVHRAIKEKLLDLSEFNLEEYEYYEQVQCGDWNWITPSFLAFASPNDREYVAALKANNGNPPPSSSVSRKLPQVFTNTVRYFKERNIKLVVRLNNPLYDKAVFEDAGIAHLDLYFDDGSNPSDEILREFIKRADEVISKGGAIAVHCKAGLGRTGVLIGAYLVWKYGFSASEVIGFMRIMRPGCVVGPQQHFMYQNFVEWVRWSVRDEAMAAARKTIEAERAVMAARLGQAKANGASRRPLKRQSMSEEEEDEEEVEDAVPAAPVTPRVHKKTHVVPATAAPAVKPVPCVGQPRKSPSPSRRRPAHQVYANGATPGPSTAATQRLTRGGLRSTSSRLASIDLPRSASAENLALGSSASTSSQGSNLQTTTAAAPSTPTQGVSSLRTSWEALATTANAATPPSRSSSKENNALASTTSMTPSRAAAAPGTPRSAGRVLIEAQRLNSATPKRESLERKRSGDVVTAATTPTSRRGNASPAAEPISVTRSSARTHERSRSSPAPPSPVAPDEDDVFGGASPRQVSPSSPPQVTTSAEVGPGTPNRASRVPSFKASPNVRATYGLKDSKLPPPRSPRADGETSGAGATKVTSSSQSSSLSDAEVLGVLGVNGAAEKAASGRAAVATASTTNGKPASTTTLRTIGRTPSSNSSISPAKIRGGGGGGVAPLAPSTAASGSVRSTSGSARLGARTPSGSRTNGVAGPSARIAAAAAGGASVSSSSTTTSTTTTTRRTVSRMLSNNGDKPTTASATSATSAALPKGTTPISNSANAAMLAARANLKRARPSPDVPQGGFTTVTSVTGAGGGAGGGGSKPPVAGHASRFASGRNVRRRRSSLGDTDLA